MVHAFLFKMSPGPNMGSSHESSTNTGESAKTMHGTAESFENTRRGNPMGGGDCLCEASHAGRRSSLKKIWNARTLRCYHAVWGIKI